MDRVDEELKPQVAQWAAHYDHRLKLGNKPIFHLEGVHNFIRMPSNQLSVSRSIRSEDYVHPEKFPRGLHGVTAASQSLAVQGEVSVVVRLWVQLHTLHHCYASSLCSASAARRIAHVRAYVSSAC